MDYQKKANVHAAMAMVRNETWQCDCKACKRAKRESYMPQITERIELIALIIETGEGNSRQASRQVNLMDDDEVKLFIPKKLERLNAQIAIERLTKKNLKQEPAEKNIEHPANIEPQTAGGGKRIIRKYP